MFRVCKPPVKTGLPSPSDYHLGRRAWSFVKGMYVQKTMLTYRIGNTKSDAMINTDTADGILS